MDLVDARKLDLEANRVLSEGLSAYEILGVEEGCSNQDDINRAFEEAGTRWKTKNSHHPLAAVAFERVQLAYNTIVSHASRTLYNMACERHAVTYHKGISALLLGEEALYGKIVRHLARVRGKLDVELPSIIALGMEGEGKSSFLERLTSLRIFPCGEKYKTRIPVRVKLRFSAFEHHAIVRAVDSPRGAAIPFFHQQASTSPASSSSPRTSSTTTTTYSSVAHGGDDAGYEHLGRDSGRENYELRVRFDTASEEADALIKQRVISLMQKITQSRSAASTNLRSPSSSASQEIQVEIRAPNVPSIDIIDLPGLVQYPLTPAKLSADTIKRYLVEEKNAVVLAVMAANSPHIKNSPLWRLLRERSTTKERIILALTMTDCRDVDLSTFAQIMGRAAGSDLGAEHIVPVSNAPDTQIDEANRLEASSLRELCARCPRLEYNEDIMGLSGTLRILEGYFRKQILDTWIGGDQLRLDSDKKAIAAEKKRLGRDPSTITWAAVKVELEKGQRRFLEHDTAQMVQTEKERLQSGYRVPTTVSNWSLLQRARWKLLIKEGLRENDDPFAVLQQQLERVWGDMESLFISKAVMESQPPVLLQRFTRIVSYLFTFFAHTFRQEASQMFERLLRKLDDLLDQTFSEDDEIVDWEDFFTKWATKATMEVADAFVKGLFRLKEQYFRRIEQELGATSFQEDLETSLRRLDLEKKSASVEQLERVVKALSKEVKPPSKTRNSATTKSNKPVTAPAPRGGENEPSVANRTDLSPSASSFTPATQYQPPTSPQFPSVSVPSIWSPFPPREAEGFNSPLRSPFPAYGQSPYYSDDWLSPPSQQDFSPYFDSEQSPNVWSAGPPPGFTFQRRDPPPSS